MTREAPYGSWASPISIDLMLSSRTKLTMPRWDGADLYWLEERPLEGGRMVVVRRSGGVTADVTPQGFNARTRVHEYGGGSYVVDRGVVWFTNYRDQRLYRQEREAAPVPITPAADIRHADMLVDRRRNLLYAVREDHTDTSREAVNTLVALDALRDRDAITIASGNDFYSTPRLSADGDRLAWLTWNHPNMPWNSTELWVAELDPRGAVRSSRRIAGGGPESICEPEWGPSGELYFVSDRNGWWNLYRARGEGDEPITRLDAEFAGPHWVFGRKYYAVLGSDELVCTYAKNGAVKIARVPLATGKLEPVDLFYNQFTDIDESDGKLALIAASPTLSPRVLTLDLETGAEEVVRAASDVHIDPGYFSIPRSIEFPTEHGLTAHAIYFGPKNRDFTAPEHTRPPLLVHCHGGPTSEVRSTYDLEIQYWTSRGFAWVDVNYGGSTGYGRPYRDRLHLEWGEVDVADCMHAARHLVREGLADGDRVAIGGGSAGGYTTLLALTKHDYFKAGSSLYGVGDLVTFVKDTHKFESRYLDWLVGPYPERADVYRNRSAVNFATGLNCPIILFQGMEDVIVPPSQSQEFVAACEANHLPYAYLEFEGEQHGFRKDSSLRKTLEAELYFFARIFGFEPHDRVEPIEIHNLPA
ncbi:MAG TPA: prolyl oligopeptidase family serine peptidase [Candidatus Dormibacteraeota bacterium]|nr:prolyl oligopeptidase family serine peptidase [Candidatus Dormibacteraeota bacterium]